MGRWTGKDADEGVIAVSRGLGVLAAFGMLVLLCFAGQVFAGERVVFDDESQITWVDDNQGMLGPTDSDFAGNRIYLGKSDSISGNTVAIKDIVVLPSEIPSPSSKPEPSKSKPPKRRTRSTSKRPIRPKR